MSRALLTLLTFPLAGLAAAAPDRARAEESGSATVAIVRARAYTIAAPQPIENATIVLRDGRIAEVVAGIAAPAGARVVDAAGRVVTPGFMNAGTQIGLVEVASDDDTADHSVDSVALGAAFDVQYAIDPNSLTVQKARAEGLSRAVVFPGSSGVAPLSGAGALLHLVTGHELIERPRAAMYATIGGASAARAGGSRAAQWLLLRNALDEARDASAKRPQRQPDERRLSRLDIAALQAVLDGSMPLVLGVHRESDIRNALLLARDFDIRVIVHGGAEAWRVARELASARVPVVLDPLAGLPMSYDEIGARRDNAARLAEAGVDIAFSVPGSGIYLSYEAGSALREAAGVAVANGLAYDAALRALTAAPAQIWGIADRYGTLERGRDADLVVWDGDPLEPSSAPAHVFVAGREIDRRTRQTELRDRYRPRAAAPATAPVQP